MPTQFERQTARKAARKAALEAGTLKQIDGRTAARMAMLDRHQSVRRAWERLIDDASGGEQAPLDRARLLEILHREALGPLKTATEVTAHVEHAGRVSIDVSAADRAIAAALSAGEDAGVAPPSDD